MFSWAWPKHKRPSTLPTLAITPDRLQLGHGVNLGNMLEASREGDWGQKLQSDYFPTKDVDVMVKIATLVDYYALEERLRASGLPHDTGHGTVAADLRISQVKARV